MTQKKKNWQFFSNEDIFFISNIFTLLNENVYIYCVFVCGCLFMFSNFI